MNLFSFGAVLEDKKTLQCFLYIGYWKAENKSEAISQLEKKTEKEYPEKTINTGFACIEIPCEDRFFLGENK